MSGSQDTSRKPWGTGGFLSRLGGEIRPTLKIGGPLALGELGWMSTYIVDALMIGRLPHSALAIAASSLGNTIYYAIVFFVIYLLNGMEAMVPQAVGRGDRGEGVRLLGQSFWIVLIGTPVVMGATMASLLLLPHFGTPPEVVAEARTYLNALIWSTGPLLAYMALRRYLQGISRVLLVSVSLITAGVVNWAGDWAFLFGHLGLRPMGVAGSGWGTCVVRVWMLLLLVVGVAHALRHEGLRFEWSMLRPDWSRLRPMLKIGLPSGIDFSLDLLQATALGVLAAKLGTTLLAANQVVLDLTAFLYMVPTGLSYAAIIRVGQGYGRMELRQIRRSITTVVALSAGFTLLVAIPYVGWSRVWAGMYTNDSAVAAAAAPLFLFCAVGLLADSIAVSYAGALTGLSDTRSPLVANLIGNWVLGVPTAWWLGVHMGFGLRGIWFGRIVGSTVPVLIQSLAWNYHMRKLARTSEPAKLPIMIPSPAK
ncbi:MATE family efflux transporter [Terriglobus aquaticus]|uniref:MATE family efflux transporter n=1 Tax=Terriglobus aquaticus TaxID=940139 RepID=UPI0021DFE89C|nr:MATE family efflux transporter [Terriglobus aquaticus]